MCELAHTGQRCYSRDIHHHGEDHLEELTNMNPMLLYDLEKFHLHSFSDLRITKDKFIADDPGRILNGVLRMNCTAG
jgi:hypothetical protein